VYPIFITREVLHSVQDFMATIAVLTYRTIMAKPLKVTLLILLHTSFLHGWTQSNPYFVFQVGTRNVQEQNIGFFFRYWVVGGKFDSDLATNEFGEIEYGQISVQDPHGKTIYKELVSGDIRVTRSYYSTDDTITGTYTAFLAFIHEGKLEQLTQTIAVKADSIMGLATTISPVLDDHADLQINWQTSDEAAEYDVFVWDVERGSHAFTRTDNSPVTFRERDYADFQIKIGKYYKVEITAFSASDKEPKSGQVNVSTAFLVFSP
jgi:hypothetical protein